MARSERLNVKNIFDRDHNDMLMSKLKAYGPAVLSCFNHIYMVANNCAVSEVM